MDVVSAVLIFGKLRLLLLYDCNEIIWPHKLSCGPLSIDISAISLALLCGEEVHARLEVLHGLEDMTLRVGKGLVQNPILLVLPHAGSRTDPLLRRGSTSFEGEDLLPQDVRLLQLPDALLQRLHHLHRLRLPRSQTSHQVSAAHGARCQLANGSARGGHCCVLGSALLRCAVAAEHGGRADGAVSLTRGVPRVAGWSES